MDRLSVVSPTASRGNTTRSVVFQWQCSIDKAALIIGGQSPYLVKLSPRRPPPNGTGQRRARSAEVMTRTKVTKQQCAQPLFGLRYKQNYGTAARCAHFWRIK